MDLMFARLLGNSVFVAGLGTAFACALGFAAALAALALPAKAKRGAVAAAVLVLVLPPFLVANTWLHFLGLAGSWRAWWPFEIYSHAGVIWIFALTFWPIPFLLCLAAWEKLDATMFEVEPALRGFKLVRWLLWPSARRALAHAALITFALQMNQFSVPAILQVKVLPAELWLRLSTQLDLAGALRTSLPAVIMTLLLVILLRHQEVPWPRLRGAAGHAVVRRQLGGPGILAGCISVAAVIASLAVPLAQLLFDPITWRDLPKVLDAAPALVSSSLLFASAGACAAGFLGWLMWRTPIGWVAWLLFVTPGVLLGAGFARVLPGTVTAVVLALGLRYLAIAWQGTRLAMRATDPSLIDVVRLETSSRWALLRQAYWPQIGPVVAAAAYLCYVLALWDIETLILIYPPGRETLALRIFNLLHYGHIGQVNALCLILLGLALAPLAGWSLWRWIARWRN